MPARKQQTFAKRARELAVKEKRERKAAKKAEARAARADGVVDESVDGSPPAHEEDEAAATLAGQEVG
jgi:hypothetical protein